MRRSERQHKDVACGKACRGGQQSMSCMVLQHAETDKPCSAKEGEAKADGDIVEWPQ